MRRFKYVVSALLSVVILVGSIAIIGNKQNITDWWFLRTYTPSAEIAQLAESLEMTEKARRLFYVHNPQLKDKETFREFCTIAESSIVLGCYVNTEGIYILNVTDSRLAGVKQVTAAHEMLHAAYERLSPNEKEEINKLTEAAYQASTNKRLREMVENYRKRDPGIVPNELHSIIGTELRNISPELEEYYQKYFLDRMIVVDYAEDYETVFIEQQEQIDNLNRQINLLQEQLTVLRNSIAKQEDYLVTEAQRLEGLRSGGDPTSFNKGVDAYNTAVSSYQADIATYNREVQDLNNIIAQYNTLANEQKGLVEAIDSRNL